MHYEEGEKDAVSVGGRGDASEPYASARTARRCTSKRQWSQLGSGEIRAYLGNPQSQKVTFGNSCH